jgi:Flp pilus assembly protein TadG
MNGLGQRQRGIVAVVVAIGLLALLAMAGLALDSGHLILNKSRLQNTVDSAALAAAKVLDQTGSEAQATTAARSIFDLNAANHPELSSVLSGADINLQYSNTLEPWAPGSAPARYVRVVANDFSMWTSFTSLVGIPDTTTAASAVSGPIPLDEGESEGSETCDLVPMMVCADLTPGAPGYFGYQGNNVTLLKIGSNHTGPIGPGNFQLFELGGAGANVVRQNLAGAYNQCIDPGGTITTKPGNNTGPTAQGLNTRFGQYQGGGMNPNDFPPDKVVTQPSRPVEVNGAGLVVFEDTQQPVDSSNFAQLGFTHSTYESRTQNGPYDHANGELRRRELAVPFVDCTETVNGHGTIPVVGIGCFFLLQEVVQQGNENFVYGEFVEGGCQASGTPAPDPNPDPEDPGPYKIVLHNDPLSPDS